MKHSNKCSLSLRFGTFLFLSAASLALGDQDASPPRASSTTQPAEVSRFAETRAKLAADPYRPLYHFSTPEGILNDPNGMTQWQGKYHLFYQLRPVGDKRYHWGHAYSDDLVHWRDLPLAISPTSAERQAYSGQTLVEKDRVIAMYHGKGRGNFIATSRDPLLVNWERLSTAPAIPMTQTNAEGQPVRIFDPAIWKESDGYYSLSGTYQNGERGPGKSGEMVQHLFRSQDLAKWDYVGPLVEGTRWTEPGEDGAVPNFLPIGNGKHILIFFSHVRAAQYMIGTYDQAKHRFTPESHGRFNHGPWLMGSLHAPSAFIDATGRLITIFNMRENMVSAADPERGIKPGEWYGIMTVPRQLWLGADDRLRMKPVPELEALRQDHNQVKNLDIPANELLELKTIKGKSLELEAVFQSEDAREFGLEVLRSPTGKEKTVITFYRDVGMKDNYQVGLDVSQGSLRADVKSRAPEIASFQIGKTEPIRVRVFIDQSIVEVFVNDVQALALRVYPQLAESEGVAIFSRGNNTTLLSLDAWKMRRIWSREDAK